MKKIYAMLALSCTVFCTQAQFAWAKAEGLWAYDYGYGIANDNSGNVYVAGKFEEAAAFSGATLNCMGNHDAFLAKYTPSGTLMWIRTAGGINGDYAEAIACDGSNYVYTSGEIEGYNDMISFSGSSITLQCVGDNDVYIAKYDLDGNLIWAKREGYLNSEKAIGITYDGSGNVYICGYFTTSTRFNNVPHTGAGGRDIFVAKYNASGVFQWVRYAGSSGRDEAKSIKCDMAGNVYICGMYSSSTNFDGIVCNSANGYYDAFLAKYNSAGVIQWVRTGGGDYDEVGWSVTIDNAGKIYVAGEFNASADFGPTQLITSGHSDVFVACYDDAGAIMWVKRAGGPLIDRARGIGTDGTNIFITGQFGATATFGSSQVNAADSSDIFIAALNNAGSFLWSLSVGGVADDVETLGYESGNAVCAEASGNVYATGGLLNGGIFGSHTVSGYTRTDVFVAKIGNTGIGLSENLQAEQIFIYPNPAKDYFEVTLDARWLVNNSKIKVYDAMGVLVCEKTMEKTSRLTIDMGQCSSGIYLLEVMLDDGTLLRKRLVLSN